MTNGTDITTPVGRIVWGNPLKSQPQRDNQGKPKIDPETGQTKTQWSFGLAVPKDQAQPIFDAMQQQAAVIYPQGQVPPSFAWKYIDGDSVDNKGQPYSNREGYAGCIVLAMTTYLSAPQVVKADGNGGWVQVTEGVKTGDYARVGLNIKGHAAAQGIQGAKPGLYLNPIMVEFAGYGDEIRSGPSADTFFNQPIQGLPPGASATPTAPSGPSAPGMPPSAPAPSGAPGQAPAGDSAQHTPPAGAPPAAPQAPAAPAVSGPAGPAAGPAAGPGGEQPQPNYPFLQGPQNN